MVNLIKQTTSQLDSLKIEYDAKVKNKECIKEINGKIRTAAKEGFMAIEYYLEKNTVTKEDLIALQILRENLEQADKTDLSKLNRIIEKISLIGVDKVYFRTTANWEDELKFLLYSLKEVFVGKIIDKINQQIFYIWNQKLRFHSTLENLVKLNEIRIR